MVRDDYKADVLTTPNDGIPKPAVVLFSPEKLQLEWSSSRGAGMGLRNNNNTCYLNAVLQCLTYCPPLFNYLNSKEHKYQCKLTGFCMICELQTHVRHCMREPRNRNRDSSVSPQSIIANIKMIAKHFSYGRQEDAHEFLRYVVEAMQKSCLFGCQQDLDRFSKDTTVVNQIFGGYLRSQIICLECKEESNTFDPLMDISLDIKNVNTLEEAFERFIRPETLDKDNAYSCPRCKEKVPAQKRFTVHRAPNILTLQLKRFEVSGDKVTQHVIYPKELDLRSYMSIETGPPVFYSLYAILTHVGNSASSGHYFCTVRAPNMHWFTMNDQDVYEVKRNSILNTEAYLLFYCRIKAKMESDEETQKPMNKGDCTSSHAWHSHHKAAYLTTKPPSGAGLQRWQHNVATGTFPLAPKPTTVPAGMKRDHLPFSLMNPKMYRQMSQKGREWRSKRRVKKRKSIFTANAKKEGPAKKRRGRKPKFRKKTIINKTQKLIVRLPPFSKIKVEKAKCAMKGEAIAPVYKAADTGPVDSHGRNASDDILRIRNSYLAGYVPDKPSLPHIQPTISPSTSSNFNDTRKSLANNLSDFVESTKADMMSAEYFNSPVDVKCSMSLPLELYYGDETENYIEPTISNSLPSNLNDIAFQLYSDLKYPLVYNSDVDRPKYNNFAIPGEMSEWHSEDVTMYGTMGLKQPEFVPPEVYQNDLTENGIDSDGTALSCTELKHVDMDSSGDIKCYTPLVAMAPVDYTSGFTASYIESLSSHTSSTDLGKTDSSTNACGECFTSDISNVNFCSATGMKSYASLSPVEYFSDVTKDFMEVPLEDLITDFLASDEQNAEMNSMTPSSVNYAVSSVTLQCEDDVGKNYIEASISQTSNLIMTNLTIHSPPNNKRPMKAPCAEHSSKENNLSESKLSISNGTVSQSDLSNNAVSLTTDVKNPEPMSPEQANVYETKRHPAKTSTGSASMKVSVIRKNSISLCPISLAPISKILNKSKFCQSKNEMKKAVVDNIEPAIEAV